MTDVFADFPEVKNGEPLVRHTTMRVGGPAEWYYPMTSMEVGVPVLLRAIEHAIPITVLGRGSNVIVSDTGVRGLVVEMRTQRTRRVDERHFVAEAGISLSALANAAYAEGFIGVEFLPSIPGSLGGAIRGNAGCWGSETKDIVATVDVLTGRGVRKELTNAECQFAYRHSIFKTNHDIVLGATLVLTRGDIAAARAQMLEWVRKKNASQPTTEASSGCIFKNPDPETSGGRGAGKLIEDAGLKGKRIGGIAVSEKHANFLVNRGGGTADHLMQMISLIKQKVRVQFGVQLETEVQILGF